VIYWVIVSCRRRKILTIEINRRTGRVVVEHVMMIKRHTRPNPSKQIKGGIAEREASIHASNVKKVENQ